jgi:hypothetical protein
VDIALPQLKLLITPRTCQGNARWTTNGKWRARSALRRSSIVKMLPITEFTEWFATRRKWLHHHLGTQTPGGWHIASIWQVMSPQSVIKKAYGTARCAEAIRLDEGRWYEWFALLHGFTRWTIRIIIWHQSRWRHIAYIH